MGMIERIIGMGGTVTAVGNAATGVAEVFTQNQTRRMELDEEAYARAMAEYGAEFAAPPRTAWDSAMNGLNRLPRPLLTLGTIGLFVYAMVAPVGFSARMEGLALVPEPLWWLMGAIVSFYFGSREAYYFRNRAVIRRSAVAARPGGGAASDGAVPADDPLTAALSRAMAAPAAVDASAAPVATPAKGDFTDNPALADWAASRG